VLDLLLPQVRRFLREALDPEAIDREARLPADVLTRAADLGLFGITIPEEHGGLGLSLGDCCSVVGEIARVDRSLATTVGLHSGLGTRGLVELGSDELRGRWLAELATGERIGAFCATEPQAGSDLTAMRTTATVEGSELVLHGEKAYVTNGGFAGLFTVLARTPGLGGARGTSLLLVPRETPGVEIGPEEHKLGIRGSSTVTVRFDGARVPLDSVVGTPGRGLEHAHRILQWGRTIMSAGCIGTARAALDATLDHVRARRQFGKAIGQFDASRAHVAWMAGHLYAMEALVEHVSALEQRGEPIPVESAAAKVVCSEGAWEICDRAIQLHGAMGFLEDTGVARMLRDCRVTRIFEGANDVLLVHAGTAVAGAPKSTPRRVHREPEGALRTWSRRWATLDQHLDAELAQARKRHGVGLVRRQLLLRRFAQSHALLLAASAALERARRHRGPVDEALAVSAVSHLLAEADARLSASMRGEEDTLRDRRLTDFLYEGTEHDVPPRPRAVQEVLR